MGVDIGAKTVAVLEGHCGRKTIIWTALWVSSRTTFDRGTVAIAKAVHNPALFRSRAAIQKAVKGGRGRKDLHISTGAAHARILSHRLRAWRSSSAS